jgi:histidinol dehydrogenase
MLTRLDLRTTNGATRVDGASGVRAPGPAGDRDDLLTRLPRPATPGGEPVEAVRAILEDVRARGDVALRELTARFDGVEVDDVRVPEAECDAALARTEPALREALEVAAEAITAYHAAQVQPEATHEHNGVRVRSLSVPVDRAGCYVPGGRAIYPSTVLMTALPAKVAGVPGVVLAVPPDRATGLPPDATLAAAAVAGVNEVYRVGGAQAIGALAYGTESIRPVDVIVGPGNVYVAVAKRLVAGEGLVGVPSAFAGPSEVVVVADASAPADLAAIDIVVQAEHGPGGLAWLITWDEVAAKEITEAVAAYTVGSPRRGDIESTLADGGYAVLVDGPEQAMAVANAIAPEHLQLMVADPEPMVALVRNAGAVFTGPWAPASLGDYLAGPSHVLPTNGSARFGQALTVADFTKHVHVVDTDQAAMAALAPHLVALAEAEGLLAHAESARRRAAR